MSDSPPSDPSAGTFISDYFEQIRARAALAETARPANKAALFDALARAGITAVIVEFDGSCDDGQIESVAARAGDAPVDLPADLITISAPRRDGAGLETRTCPVAEAIEVLVYALLSETHDGWENNDGAFGTFTLDVADRSIQLEFNERVMETAYSEYVF